MWKLIYSEKDRIYSIFDNKEKKIVSKYEERYMDKQDLNELNLIIESFNKLIMNF
jgi:hypothetical protein